MHVGKAVLRVAQVNLGEAAVEEDLGRIEFELEAELFIVDKLVSAEIEEGRGEVVEGDVIAGEEEVGDAALEVPGTKGVSMGRFDQSFERAQGVIET